MAFTKEQIKQLKEYNKIRSLYRNSASVKDCFYYDKRSCSSTIVRAHSLQRQGPFLVLEKIEGEQRFIFSHTDIDFTENGQDFKKLGRLNASTFTGFCKKHDTELFKEIENDYNSIDINSDKHCFLLTYRAYAQSYHAKVEELKLWQTDDEKTKNALHFRYKEDDIKRIIETLKLGISDLMRTKKQIDHAIENNDYGIFEYFIDELPYTVPIATASMVTPLVTINNKEINRSINVNNTPSVLITTVLPFKTRSVVIVAAFAGEKTSVDILDDLDIAPKIRRQRYLSFLLMHEENIFIAPAFFETKTGAWKKDYIDTYQRFMDYSEPIYSFNKSFKLNFFDRKEALSYE